MIVLTVLPYILFLIAVIASAARIIIRRKNVFDHKKRVRIDLIVLGLYALAFLMHYIGR